MEKKEVTGRVNIAHGSRRSRDVTVGCPACARPSVHHGKEKKTRRFANNGLHQVGQSSRSPPPTLSAAMSVMSRV